ncbi:MAG: hypothetical protein ACM3OO_05960 [Planctomycetaceae bacterium]
MQTSPALQNGSAIRGRRIGSGVDAANRRFADGRVCATPGCATVLSVYNPRTKCWQHDERRPYFVRVPRRRRDAA